jgi:hypothetical protein
VRGEEMHPTFKEDNYSKNRGRYSRIIDIYCRRCKSHVGYYQKDGGTKTYPGQLRRVYIDRFLDKKSEDMIKKIQLTCNVCGEILGTKITYKKEQRKAFRLYVGAVKYKILKMRENKK